MPTLVVYGATSYTATQHLLPYLAQHPDAGSFDLILAGRNAGRLEAANALLPGSTRKILAVSLDDTAAVDAMVKRADGIINLAGPYSKHNGEALIDACVKHGKHYFDLTGEVWWLKNKVIRQYDYLASQSGACIVPMCGFEALPGDISIYHGLKTLQAREGRDVAFKTSTNFYDIAGGVSGGTIASVKAFAESGEKDIDEWSLLAASCLHPNPPMRLCYTPPAGVPGVPPFGAWYIGGATNRATYRRSWFLSKLRGSTISHASNVQFNAAELDNEPRHGPNTVFDEALYRSSKMVCSSRFITTITSLIIMVCAGLYVASEFVRNLVENKIPQPGEGPKPEVCAAGWTRVTNVAETDGEKRLAVVTQYTAKGDPGYSHTARILAEMALTMILPAPAGTSLPPLARIGGVLTPSTAGGAALIERLKKNDVAQIESQILTIGAAEDKKTI